MLRYKNSLLERILLEKGTSRSPITPFLSSPSHSNTPRHRCASRAARQDRQPEPRSDSHAAEPRAAATNASSHSEPQPRPPIRIEYHVEARSRRHAPAGCKPGRHEPGPPDAYVRRRIAQEPANTILALFRIAGCIHVRLRPLASSVEQRSIRVNKTDHDCSGPRASTATTDAPSTSRTTRRYAAQSARRSYAGYGWPCAPETDAASTATVTTAATSTAPAAAPEPAVDDAAAASTAPAATATPGTNGRTAACTPPVLPAGNASFHDRRWCCSTVLQCSRFPAPY